MAHRILESTGLEGRMSVASNQHGIMITRERGMRVGPPLNMV